MLPVIEQTITNVIIFQGGNSEDSRLGDWTLVSSSFNNELRNSSVRPEESFSVATISLSLKRKFVFYIYLLVVPTVLQSEHLEV